VASRKAAARPDADPAGLPGGGGPVGRDDVLAQLRFAAEEAVTGRGELILLTGEAGIGKTTMLSEAARYAETRGIRVAWGFCGPDDSAPAYWPWAQVARELCPEAWEQAQSGLGHDVLPEPDAQAVAARFRLFDLVTAALLAESRIQPDLILLDDLQWADEASLLFLDFFIRRLRAGSAAVIGAYRDVSPAPGAALIRVSARGRVLPLTGLAAADVARLVARVAGQPLADSAGPQVHQRTGGNPFYVQQVSWLLATGQAGLPPGVSEALADRFAGLPADAVEVLGLAAVVGQPFSAGLLAEVAGRPVAETATALAEAAAARLVTAAERAGPDAAPGAGVVLEGAMAPAIPAAPGVQPFRFAHDLFREHAYRRLAAQDRARLHGQAGAVLAARRAAGADVPLAELARHFSQADPHSADTFRYCAAAAREAAGQLAYEEAVRHWEAALTAVSAAPPGPGLTATLLDLAEALGRAGDLTAAGDAFRRAAGLARRQHDAPALARAALGLQAIGTRAWWPPDEIIAVLTEALAALPDGQAGGESATEVTDDAGRAAAQATAGQPGPGPTGARPDGVAQDRAAPGGAAPDGRGPAGNGDAGSGAVPGHDPDGPGQAGGALRARVMAGLARVLAWHQIDLPRAAGLADGAVAAARAAGDPRLVASCLIAQHNAHWQPGNPADRRAIAVAAAGCAREAGDQELLAEARLLIATDLLELADPAFRAELSGFLDLAGTAPEPRLRYAALARRAMIALLGGQFAEAERLIGEAAAAGRECGDPGADDVRTDQGWELMSALGRLDELAGVAAGMFPDPDSTQARGLRAWVLLARGDPARAAELIAPELAIGGPGRPPPPPAGRQWLFQAASGAELIAELGDQPGVPAAAAALYHGLAPFTDLAVVSGAAISFRGAVAHHRGALALAAGRPAEAAALLAQAADTHDRLGAEVWRLRSHYHLARAWLALSDDPAALSDTAPDSPATPGGTDPRYATPPPGLGRRAAALELLAGTAAAARAMGMDSLAAAADAAAHAAGAPPATAGRFARDGGLWTLSYAGATVRMRHAKGLSDLAVLLGRPGQPVSAADLIAASDADGQALASLRLGADEVLDATARQQIRTRLDDLAEEITEAEDWADPERASRARTERDALLHELSAAAGLAGRPRLLGDQGERARKTVTARIRDVISRIERVHPALGSHLRATITTGTSCAYSPPAPVTWDL
jgi:tetratricopeptide (TPR) repeat protein